MITVAGEYVSGGDIRALINNNSLFRNGKSAILSDSGVVQFLVGTDVTIAYEDLLALETHQCRLLKHPSIRAIIIDKKIDFKTLKTFSEEKCDILMGLGLDEDELLYNLNNLIEVTVPQAVRRVTPSAPPLSDDTLVPSTSGFSLRSFISSVYDYFSTKAESLFAAIGNFFFRVTGNTPSAKPGAKANSNPMVQKLGNYEEKPDTEVSALSAGTSNGSCSSAPSAPPQEVVDGYFTSLGYKRVGLPAYRIACGTSDAREKLTEPNVISKPAWYM